MFILLKNDGTTLALLPDKCYILGRKSADINLEDVSVSRKQAEISIENGQVLIKDLKSSNKTFLNGTALVPQQKTVADVGCEVRFGNKDSIFILQRDRLVVTTSLLKVNDKANLSLLLTQMSGKFCVDWSPECTHVVVNELYLTGKVLCALITKQEIVTVQFFEKRLNAMQSNLTLPKAEDFRPSLVDKNARQVVTVNYKRDRDHLFRNKIFVFPNERSLGKMSKVISLAGGEAVTLESGNLSVKKLQMVQKEYLFIITDENSQSDDTAFNDCVKYLKTVGKRSIPLQEIALAVLSGNCDNDCNPNFNRVAHVLSAKPLNINTAILAPETQTPFQSTGPMPQSEQIIIPSTFENIKKRAADEEANETEKRLRSNDGASETIKTAAKESCFVKPSSPMPPPPDVCKRKSDEIIESTSKKSKLSLKAKNKSKLMLKSKTGFSKLFEQNTGESPPKTSQSGEISEDVSDLDDFHKTPSLVKLKPTSPFEDLDDLSIEKEPDSVFDIPGRKTRMTQNQPNILSPNKKTVSKFTQKLALLDVLEDPITVVASKRKNLVEVDRQNASQMNKCASLGVVKDATAVITKAVTISKNLDEVKPASKNFLSSTRIEGIDDASFISTRNTTINENTKSVSTPNESSSKFNKSGIWYTKGNETNMPVTIESEYKLDEDMQTFIQSFKTKVVVVKMEKLLINNSFHENTLHKTSAQNNYKKFKKVLPKNIQTTIIPRANLKKVVCGFTGSLDDSEIEEEQQQPSSTQLKVKNQHKFSTKMFFD